MSATVARWGVRERKTGFSLIEMLFVVIILGLIAALAVPRLGKAFGKSQVKTTKAQLSILSDAIEDFRLSMNRYPTEEEGLISLIEKPDGADSWEGPYLNKRVLPTDGWGHSFVYRLDPQFDFVIVSLGADGQPGGDGDNSDLDNRS